jgi:DNA topoisomerase-1
VLGREVPRLNNQNRFKLIIAEKPDAAKRIATALGEDTIRKAKRGELPLYEITRRGNRVVVMAALGHLYTLKQSGKGWDYPVLKMEWVPKYEAEKSAKNTKLFIDKFKELSLGAESFIVATDYDIEGETIAYCILKYACGEQAANKAKRMKFSTLTDKELVLAYENPLPQVNFRMAEAGETRHKVDWLFGINISRALMLAVKHSAGIYRTLSTGRVQGPTLTFIANRESAIRSFVPTPYWTIEGRAEFDGKFYPLTYSKDKLPTKNEALQVLAKSSNKKGKIADIVKKNVRNLPPYPFDLGSLQTEAYKLFHFTPSRTLSLAERLYLSALISYPRTGSQKIPPSLDARNIFKSLAQLSEYRALATVLAEKEKLVPNQGKKDDPAHPPVTPTGALPPKDGLSEPERKIYDLVVRRFMAVYGDQSVSESIKASVDVNGEIFYLRGRRTVERGWTKFYEPYFRMGDISLPDIREGQIIDNIRLSAEERYTSAPPRYNPSTLLRLMEDQGIGTKATRADIIDTLSRRGYVNGEHITITELGLAVIDVLKEYSPQMLSVEMTRRLEHDMERIQFGDIRGEQVLSETIDFLRPVLEKFKGMEKPIGATLGEALQKAEKKSRTIGACPVCRTGELVIIRSKKTGKRFIGCTNYRNAECNFSAPLPQRGEIEITGRNCQVCGFPTIVVKTKGRRPWQLCINMKCERNPITRLRRANTE